MKSKVDGSRGPGEAAREARACKFGERDAAHDARADLAQAQQKSHSTFLCMRHHNADRQRALCMPRILCTDLAHREHSARRPRPGRREHEGVQDVRAELNADAQRHDQVDQGHGVELQAPPHHHAHKIHLRQAGTPQRGLSSLWVGYSKHPHAGWMMGRQVQDLS